MLSCECRAHGCSAIGPSFFNQKYFSTSSWHHTYWCSIFYLNFFQFRLGIGSHQFIQGDRDCVESVRDRRLSSPCWSQEDTRVTKRTPACAGGQSQVYASLTSHPVTTMVSSTLGYTRVHSVTSNDAWNKCVVAALGTSSEACWLRELLLRQWLFSCNLKKNQRNKQTKKKPQPTNFQ